MIFEFQLLLKVTTVDIYCRYTITTFPVCQHCASYFRDGRNSNTSYSYMVYSALENYSTFQLIKQYMR